MVAWKNEWKKLAGLGALFAACFFLPVASETFRNALFESFKLVRWYAREHIVLCLLPAFFIAGAIAVFVKQQSVMKYLGAGANKLLAYGVASVSGTILAVCSCTVLPLFAGIYRMGAGLGPACAFLYSGPAINVLAIILTATILGPELGIARAVGAVSFSVIIGLLMQLIFRKEETKRIAAQAVAIEDDENSRPLWKTVIYFASMVGVLVFANFGAPSEYNFTSKANPAEKFQAVIVTSPEEIADRREQKLAPVVKVEYLSGNKQGTKAKIDLDKFQRVPVKGFFFTVRSMKWELTAGFAVVFGIVLIAWLGVSWWKVLLAGVAVAGSAFSGLDHRVTVAVGIVALAIVTDTTKGQPAEWFASSWEFTKQIIPLLIVGVMVAGFLLGQPHSKGVIPEKIISESMGDNGLISNLIASVAGAFMYFATLTEVPIVQALKGSGMAKGPQLALLLAGPALSLPNMLVIRSVMGTKKTLVYVSLVVVMATLSGMVYGNFI